MPIRKASAEWKGNLKEGDGTFSFADVGKSYSFASRFEEGTGSNPEELIAAAHAGCFSMALSADLAGAGFTPQKLATSATVHLDPVENGFAITGIDLDCKAQVPGIDAEKFQSIAEGARQNCPVSKALSGMDIRLSAQLVE